MKRKRRTNFIVGSGYIGAGNKFSVISGKARSPFQKIKAIYGEELERNDSPQAQGIKVEELTEERRLEIRRKVKQTMLQEQRKQIISGVFAGVLTIAGLYLTFLLIKWLISNFS